MGLLRGESLTADAWRDHGLAALDNAGHHALADLPASQADFPGRHSRRYLGWLSCIFTEKTEGGEPHAHPIAQTIECFTEGVVGPARSAENLSNFLKNSMLEVVVEW